MRERDRRTYTLIWVVVTTVAAGILVVKGSPWFALALVAVALVGLVAFLRTTHPRGSGKPNINIFFDDDEMFGPDEAGEAEVVGHGAPGALASAPAPESPTRPAPPTAPPVDAGAEADVIAMRPSARREAPDAGPTLSEAVAASDQAAVSVSAGGGSSVPASPEVAEELSAHHVRLLRKVQTQLRDYE